MKRGVYDGKSAGYSKIGVYLMSTLLCPVWFRDVKTVFCNITVRVYKRTSLVSISATLATSVEHVWGIAFISLNICVRGRCDWHCTLFLFFLSDWKRLMIRAIVPQSCPFISSSFPSSPFCMTSFFSSFRDFRKETKESSSCWFQSEVNHVIAVLHILESNKLVLSWTSKTFLPAISSCFRTVNWF